MKNNKGEITMMAYFIGFIVLLSIGLIVLTNVFDTAVDMETTTPTESDTILANNGTATTLSETPEVISSVVVKNQTWLEFDGVDDYVNITYPIYRFRAGDNFTLISFINANADGKSKPIISSSFINGNVSFKFYVNNNNYTALRSYNGTTWLETTGNVLLNMSQWNQVAIRIETDGTMHFYINGKFTATKNLNISDNQDYEIYVGQYPTGSEYFNGSIDEVRIYNQSLYYAHIEALYNNSVHGSNLGVNVPTLMYHCIGDTNCAGGSSINQSNFSEQMSYLNSSGFNTITFKDYYNWVQNDFSMPKKPIILSFDDSYENWANIAVPIMNNYSFEGVAGVIANYQGDVSRLTWENITYLIDNDWEIASHSLSHSDANMTNISFSERVTQFNDSKNNIESNLSLLGYTYTVTSWVYPFNSHNSTIDSECGGYYNLCTGDSKSPLGYSYKSYNLTGGIIRTSPDNDFTTFKERVNIDDEVILQLNLNENTGTTAYDVSGNANNGTISGATWNDDGVDVALVEDTDFSISGDTFTIINDIYSWTQITIDYNYVLTTGSSSTTILRIIGVFIVLSFLGYLLIPIVKQINEFKTK